jgi:hypothetical protein
MADDQLGSIPGQGCAVARFAEALLQSMGGTQVTLRLANPSSGDTGSQLGQEAPSMADLQISPGAIKVLEPSSDGARRIEAIVSACSLRHIAKEYGVDDVPTWLMGMEGVLYRGALMRIESVTADSFYDQDCLYHLTATE